MCIRDRDKHRANPQHVLNYLGKLHDDLLIEPDIVLSSKGRRREANGQYFSGARTACGPSRRLRVGHKILAFAARVNVFFRSCGRLA